MWADVARYGEMQGDVGRCSERVDGEHADRRHLVAELGEPLGHRGADGDDVLLARGDAGEMQGRYRGDTREMRGRCGGDAGEITWPVMKMRMSPAGCERWICIACLG